MTKTLLKLAVASVLSTAVLLGAFAPQPAEAFTCSRGSIMGCSFIGLLSYGDAACCTYSCPDGSTRIRGCIQL